MIAIDGAEGGGAMLRISLALSAVTGTPFAMTSIRAGRSNPGLAAQHLHALRTVQRLCDAEVEGATIGSAEVRFAPKALRSARLEVDIGTAGSASLLIQAALLPMLFAPGRTALRITGGTDVKWSPPVDYLQNVFLPSVKRYAKNVSVRVLRRGYYPKGGGKVELVVLPDPALHKPTPHHRIVLERRGELSAIQGVSHSSLPGVADRQAAAARQVLPQARIEASTVQADCPGSGITLWARCSEGEVIGADALGERQKKAEDVGHEAAEAIKAELVHGAPVDSHLADQLIVFLALFGGSLRIPGMTDHVKNNLSVCEAFGLKVEQRGDLLSADHAFGGVGVGEGGP